MLSKKINSNYLRAKIVKGTYPNKKIFWQKVKNEVGFLQKENNFIDNKMMKKLRYLHKLKAKNLYLASVIQHSLAVKSALISINDILRCPTPVGIRKYFNDTTLEDAPIVSTCKINSLENELLKEIMSQILLTSTNKHLMPSQSKQNVLSSSASFTSEANIDFLSRLPEGSSGSGKLKNQVKD